MSKLGKRIWKHKYVYLMLLPVVASYILFSYLPMYGLVLSLKDFQPRYGILGSKWLSPLFSNFTDIFKAPYFLRAIKNTLIISALRILFCFPAPIVLALLMNEVRLAAYKKGIQTVIYLPNFISWVIFGSIVYDIFGIDGIINNILGALNVGKQGFMASNGWYYPILISFTIIKDAGWGTIIYMAAISAVSPSLYEAATVDGCGRFRMMWSVTLPCIAPIIVIQFLLAIGNIMNAGFDAVFNTYNKQIYDVADILDTYIYRTGLQEFEFGKATAIGLFKSVINFMLLITANTIIKRVNGKGMYDLGD